MIMFERFNDEQLLDELARERSKFTQADKVYMRAMIHTLIDRAVYPASTMSGNPNDVYAMVEGWGADWHTYKEPLVCPHCGCDLRDHDAGPPFKRETVLIQNDRAVKNMCPDCKKDWPR